MEDCNSLVADCIVISCCCHCLILQIIVFLLLRLPRKAAQKTRKYATKLKTRYAKIRKTEASTSREFADDFSQVYVNKSSISFAEFSAMEEVERVLGELSLEGEFVFGSFWRRESPSIACVGDRRNCLPRTNYLCKISSNSSDLFGD